MKTRTTALSIVTVALVGCSDPTDVTTPTIGSSTLDGVILRRTLERGELTGLAYDPASDAIYVLEDVHSGDQTLHRFDYVSRDLVPILTFGGQHDYGMRFVDGELWLAQSYDDAVARITDLDGTPSVGHRIELAATPGLNEVNDIAVVSGDIFVIAGNMTTNDQHNGLQVIPGPGYSTITEVVSAAAAGWPNPDYSYRRALVALDGGNLAIATGPGGALEVRTSAGALVASEPDFGSSYVQRDSQNRLYAYDQQARLVVRWAADLTDREEFSVDLGNSAIGSIRFVLRELPNKIQFIYAVERREDVVLTAVPLPL